MPNYLSTIYVESGLKALVASPRDIKILCLGRFVRFFGYGSTALVLTLFLTALGHSAEKTGLFMTLTLLGDVVISLALTIIADKIGRRQIIALGASLMAASGVIFALFSQYWILVLASIFGVISPSGNEIGPFAPIETSIISQLTASIDRSSLLAWYTLFGAAGAATGSMVMGWVVYTLQHKYAWNVVDSYRAVFWIYAALGLAKLCFSLMLSSASELNATKRNSKSKPDERQPLLSENGCNDASAATKPTKTRTCTSLLPDLSRHTIFLIAKLCSIFAIDSLGSGIASNSWMVYFFNRKFGLKEGKLGSLFFFTNILSAFSSLAAASLSRKIGLIKTMVFTHLPASIMLAIIPVPSNQVVAMALLLVRSSITSMDSAPRTAFLAAAVLPEERTTVMGVVNVCKTLSQAGGPIVSGTFAGIGRVGIALTIAGSLKGTYDILLLAMFLGYRTIEERAEERIDTQAEPERVEDTNRTPGAS